VTLRTDELDYPFDERCVATAPADPREDARLMVVDRAAGTVTHARVRDMPRWLGAGDVLAVNRTSVLRARVVLRRAGDGRATEGLFLEPRADGAWRVMIRQSKRFRAGDRLALVPHDGGAARDAIELVERDDEAWAVRVVAAENAAGAGPAPSVADVLERSGWTPLPPYILAGREARDEQGDDDDDRAAYQTVYADAAARGSVAAPTAGLHLTQPLLAQLSAQGVARADVVLHVGAGTFKPVDAPTLAEHPMHREWFEVPAETLALLRDLAPARAAGRARIVAVGTTTVRALESLPDQGEWGTGRAWSGDTRLLIEPGFRLRHVDALLTNFHLPRSTLLALVGAFVGLERLKELYALAQREGYRFYSYGDAMLVL
jgi:S-adenosylmethionine:tRNA ribosyltransferase-isomerase